MNLFKRTKTKSLCSKIELSFNIFINVHIYVEYKLIGPFVIKNSFKIISE